uniref:Serine palmitoyltransferase 1 n=1 Tax=Glossina brevipalpis TaxID=37001 RepID=A0A1A9WIQ0_9MUSC
MKKMVAIPYLFNEIERIFRNTPLYAIILEAFLLLSVIWLLLYKRNGRKQFTKEEEEELIANYEPEPLVPDTDPNHPLLHVRLVQSRVGKRVVVNGYDCLNLASHNYLGLLEDEEILEDACKSLRKYGVGSCGPRGFYGTMDVHLVLEERLAKFMRMEEAVVYSYAFSTLAMAEGIYMNTGQLCPLRELLELRAKYKLRLFLDESISFGVLGKTGRGIAEHFDVDLTEVDLISAGMEWAMGSIGGFCVGSHFIVEHQRLSGLGYCFSASLPPLLAQAAISALNRFEKEPQMFGELQEKSRLLHEIFSNFSKLIIGGDSLSPVKHLYLTVACEDINEEHKKLIQISDKCIARGVAVIEATYLYNIEKQPIRPSLRITANRLLTLSDINEAFEVIEDVTKNMLN